MKKQIKGQVSLEFLLVIGIFFSALLIILPAINISTQQMLIANDVLLAKQISEIIEEESTLFAFLGNGSEKEFEFIVAKELTLKTYQNNFEIFNEKKKFIIELNDMQQINNQTFNGKFFIQIKKENNKTQINFYE